MSMTTIEFSIPTDIYEQAKDICASCGLTLEEACVRFLEATVACGDLPFPYTQQDIEEAKGLLASVRRVGCMLYFVFIFFHF